MKLFRFISFPFVVYCFILNGCALNTDSTLPTRPEQILVKQLSFSPPNVEHWELANGLTVYCLPDDERPLVAGAFFYPGGKLWESKDLAGLASATGGLMREGSVVGISPEALDRRLDSLGANIESAGGDEFGKVGFSTLVDDLPVVFGLFGDVIRRPAFATQRVELWKTLALEGIRRRKDNPEGMASITFNQLAFGADTPFGWVPTIESVSKITEQKLREFHQRYVRPDGAILLLTGRISVEEAHTMAERVFGDWKRGSEKLAEQPKKANPVPPGLYILQKDLAQSVIAVGHQGPPRFTPDMYAISVFNRLFSTGGFESLLFREIRSRGAFAYVVDGGIFSGPQVGSFEIDLGTRNEQAIKAYSRLRELLEMVQHDDFDAVALEKAKQAVANGFVFKFDEPGEVIDRKAQLQLLNFPKQFDEQYLQNISSVTSEDVLKAAQTQIHMDSLVGVIVGNVDPQTVANAMGKTVPVYRLTFDTEPHIGQLVVPAEH